jgi:hypothetical protein
MKRQTQASAFLGAILAFGLALNASATLVRVNTTETWDGVSNPHAADGVTISGSGTDFDPYTYTIPNGMHITSTGSIVLHSPADYSIKFLIQGGDLQMEAGAILNVERFAIRSGHRVFVLDLSSTNSITGAGQIGPISNNDSCPRALTIENVRNVNLSNIDVHTQNVNTGPADFRPMFITASGAVSVSGSVNNSDQDGGGDGGCDVTIKANSVYVNNIDTRGMRNDLSGRPPYSGNVLLQALAPTGGYDSNDSVNNASTNRLTVRGRIRTVGVDDRTLQGSVTLQSVVLQLVFGVIETPPGTIQDLQVGELRAGASVGDLFADVSASGHTVQNVVKWGGSFTPPAGSPPSFTVKPVSRPSATQDVPYVGETLAGSATDPDAGTTLTYERFFGPGWLQVATDGTLSGTPTVLDAGTSIVQISVTDGTRFDTTTLNVVVVAGPRWNDANNDFGYPDAVQNSPYATTLATNVIYFGAETLTYAKLSGPEWLQVASNGALSGTPAQTNVLENVFTVSVTDHLLNTNTATMRIWVNGSPKFNIQTFSKAKATAGEDYAGMNQTLTGSAVDPQGLTIAYSKVSGPGWLSVASDGSLSGTSTPGNTGDNFWTVAANNGSYPASTATLKITVQAGVPTGPVEVVATEFWDGVANPHIGEGVVLSGSGTVDDPATYTVPRGLRIKDTGLIYTSLATGQDSEAGGAALHIKFNILGNLTLDATNNAIVTAIHARNDPAARKNLILDLNATNSILGQGRIVGLGNRVDAALFPNCFDRDTPRILTISNVVDVSLYDINVQVRSANNWGRPLNILATGQVRVTGGIDNSDRDGGGDGGNNVTVIGKTVTVNTIRSDSARTASFRNVGNIVLKALASPGYNPADGANNNSNNWLTVTGNLRASTPQTNDTWGAIATESVVLEFGAGAAMNSGANYTNTPPARLTWNVGKIKNGAASTDLFRNHSAGNYTANYVVDWSGTVPPAAPASPNLLLRQGAPGNIVMYWSGSGFVLQQNTNLSVPGGWVNAPSGTANPATNTIEAGSHFYRLKWPQ